VNSKLVERLSIEPLSVMGCPPIEWVNLGGELGLNYVTLVLQGGGGPDQFPAWSLRDDPGLRRDTLDAMRERNVSVSLVDGFVLWEDTDARSFADDMALADGLGAPRINTVSFRDDLDTNVTNFRIIADLAAEHGIMTTLEFAPPLAVRSLPQALDVIRRVDRPNFRLLLDTMHLFRSGGSVAEVAALASGTIQYIQLSDVSLVATNTDYMDESCFERKVPGTGELPLRDLLATLPHDVVIGLEVPLRTLAQEGASPIDRLSRSVEAARTLLATVTG
jgi:sugar phosphate isomerase/epimerase